MAEKINENIALSEIPMQSDYNNLVWRGKRLTYKEAFSQKGIFSFIKKLIPLVVKNKLLQLYIRYKTICAETGNLRSDYFKK